MQRKVIESIPYLKTYPIQGVEIKYTTAAEVKKINKANVLIFEIYENHKDKISVPLVRICLSAEDYENYYPAENKWSRKKIVKSYYDTEILGDYMNIRTLKRELYVSETTRNKINKFLSYERSNHIFYAINEAEEKIDQKKETKKINNADKKIKELIGPAPEHEKEFYEWAKKLIPENYMYYLRKGNIAFLTCTHCGNREKYYTGQPETLEDYARTYIDVPKSGDKCVCRFCNAQAEYKQEGHYKGAWTKDTYAYDIQNYCDNKCKAVITLFNVKKIYENGEPEKYEFKELIKAVYSFNRKTSDKAYKPHYKWTNNNGKMYWDGWSNDYISMPDVKIKQVYGIDKLQGTALQYSGMKEYMKTREISPIKYADAYLKSPELEMLSKSGLTHIAALTIRNGNQLAAGNKPYMMLGIYPERMQMLIKSKGKEDIWRVLKMEKTYNEHFGPEVIDKLRKNIHLNDIMRCLKYMSYKKCSNYMDKHKWNITTYADYLTMKEKAGYDIKNSIILYPKDLEQAHREITMEIEIRKSELRQKEMNEKFPEIQKKYKRLKSIYGYESNKFIIRPAKTAGEIVVEGSTLHHCVGSSNTYLEKHSMGKSYILFLRKIEYPDIPYCTVEISPDFRIMQRHQAYDQTPDAAEIDNFLNEYIKEKTLKRAI
jgi:hypothetical protein